MNTMQILEIQDVKLDLKGHFGNIDKSDISKMLEPSLELAKILEKRDFDEFTEKLAHSIRCGTTQCFVCGEYLEISPVGNDRYVLDKPCRVPGGYKEIKIKLNIPSGKLVIANDLRNLVDGCPDYYINYDEDKVLTSLAYADLGMFHTFLGNTCPRVIQKSTTKLAILSPAYDEENYDDTELAGEVGEICTDLWWWCGMDYNYYKQQCKKYGYAEDLFNHFIVELEPGCYEATDYHFMTNYDWKAKQLFVEINRISDVDDIPNQSNYPATSKFMESVEGFLVAKHLAWPHYATCKEEILDSAFCRRNEWKEGRVVAIDKQCEIAVSKINSGEIDPPKVVSNPDYVFTAGMWEICRDMEPIFKVPDNIKPDWLETVFWYLDRVIDAKKPTNSGDHALREWENYQRIAPTIKKEIEERFSNRIN